MAKLIEELYQEIATLMNEAIPDEWSRAWVTVELAGESALDMVGRYEIGDTTAAQSFVISPLLVRTLAELRRRMKRPGEAAWRKAVYHLTPNGKFHLDLEY